MPRHWASWWSGNYEDEGCTKPPFKFWTSGQRCRDDVDGEENDRTDLSLCAVIDAESEDAVTAVIAKHYPDAEMRFVDVKGDDFQPGSRFP
jgi:hypothetical protein